MARVLIAGNKGRMGRAAEWAAKQLGYEVDGFDFGDERPLICNYDIVASCMPYHQNFEIAKLCIDAGVSYIDLGGHVETDEQINKYASDYMTKGCVHTSAGLAPGFVNVLAEKCFSKLGAATAIRMYCGGLPIAQHHNPMKYVSNWSIDGLVNEYIDDCKVLVSGGIRNALGMSELEHLEFKGLELEAFLTSGGACHSIEDFKRRGVRECFYKTMRYPGHLEIMKWLLGRLSKDEIAKLVKNNDYEDWVLVRAEAQQGDEVYTISRVIDRSRQFTAMQRATAFSMVSAIKVMLEYKTPQRLRYEHFNVPQYFETFDHLLGEDR